MNRKNSKFRLHTQATEDRVTLFGVLPRLISAMLVLVLLSAAFAGCAKKEDVDVHVFYYTYSDTYITSVRSALGRVLRSSGLKYQDYDGNNNQTTQTEQIQTAITKGAKLLVVNLVATGSDDAASGVIQLAKDANIPVVFFNREVSDKVIKSYAKASFIGTDAAEAGRLQGDMIGDYLVKNYQKADLNGDGRISYVLFMGEKGNNEAIYRTKYSVENANAALAAAGKPALVFYDSSNSDGYLLDRDGKWSAQAANEYMTTLLSAHSTANNNMVELVICNNDGMAEGAISALSAAGYNSGKDGVTIPVFGVDATSAAKELIKSGRMAGTIKQDAEGMASAIASAVSNLLEGREAFFGLDSGRVDSDVAKLRIPYAIYVGEE